MLNSTFKSLLVPSIEVSPHFSYALACYACCDRLVTTSSNISVFNLGDSHHHFTERTVSVDIGRYENQHKRFIVDLIDRFEVDGILCATDYDLRTFSDAAKERPSSPLLCAPDRATIDLLQSKVKARQFFEAHGAPIAEGRTYCCSSPVVIDPAMMPFPVVLKRDRSEGTSGVILVRSSEELELEVRKALLLRQDFVLESFLGKTEEISVQFMSTGNGIFPLYGLRKRAHLAPSFSTAVESLTDGELRSMCDPFLNCFGALGRGVYSAQLKGDVHGRYHLIEISCRFGNNFRIVSAMWPALIPCILDFYAGGSAWQGLREQCMENSARHGVSIIEDCLGRVQRIAIERDSPRLARLWVEVRELVSLIRRRPVYDDYITNIFRFPRVVLSYYWSVTKMFLRDWQVRSRRMRFLEG